MVRRKWKEMKQPGRRRQEGTGKESSLCYFRDILKLAGTLASFVTLINVSWVPGCSPKSFLMPYSLNITTVQTETLEEPGQGHWDTKAEQKS
jgi:hypothetical protein